MKWSDLSFKERKQIYDSIKAQNPDTTYFDIKHQFDSIPEYEDGIMLTNTDKGYVDWKSKLAPNLKNETYGYDLYGAYKSGAQQQLEDDGYYHLPTRDPKTNKILKYPSHKTFWLGITEDIKQGYYPQVKDGRTYTVPVYEDGGKKIVPPKELGHIADGIAGSIKYEAEPGVDYITNPYLRYLADPDNTYTTKELRDAGFHSAARNKRYLLNPTESKSHMLTLKRALKDSNKISKWSDPVDENMILDYFRSGKANGAVRNQYDLYIDKQRYIDRLNRLVPMEWLLPTIGLGGAEFLREKQNNKSN